MRKAALGAIALLVFAGCLSAAAHTESAGSLESTAADRTDERTDNAGLVALWGVEPPRHIENEQDTVDIYLDETPGDGEAAGWSYAYIGEERGGIVVVGDGIGVIAEAWHTFEGNESQEVKEELSPIDGWEVDSQEAAEILAEDDRWPEITDSWAVFWRLMGTPQGPVWHIEAANITLDGFGQEAEAVMSAANGTILEIDHHEEGDVMAEPATGPRTSEAGCTEQEASGQVTPLSDVTSEFELEEDGHLQLEASYSGAGPVDFRLLEDGDEEVWSESEVASSTSGNRAVYEIPHLEDGDYVLEATTDAGAVTVQMYAQAGWGGGCGNADHEASSAAGTTHGQPVPFQTTPWTPVDPTMGLSSVQGDLW